MQFALVYKIPGVPDTWGGKAGRAYTPTPRTVEELAEAIQKILAANPTAEITITSANRTEPPKP